MANTPTSASKTPWHLWVVGVIYLLWSLVGAFDFFMSQTRNVGYLKSFPPALVEFVYGLPLWAVIAWGIATWGGALGSLVLLLRRRVAVGVFLAASLGMLLTIIHNFALSNGVQVMGTRGLRFSCIIFIAGNLVWLYARAMRRRGVLR